MIENKEGVSSSFLKSGKWEIDVGGKTKKKKTHDRKLTALFILN